MNGNKDAQALEWISPQEIEEELVDCKGDYILDAHNKLFKITAHQFRTEIKGIKGFILHGTVGVGKTLLPKLLAKSLNVPLLFVDGGTIARSLYGESEQQVKKIFDEASKKKCIILIDDAETVFPSRKWAKGQSWHASQNNQLLHHLDNINTSNNLVIMTTNMFELLDEAIIDRLEQIEFGKLDKQTLDEIAEKKCVQSGVKYTKVSKKIKEGMSVRGIEKLIVKEYIETITGGQNET